MLQLNHVTVTRGTKEVLSDCTFKFNEGVPYILVSEDPEDFKAFFNCACRQKATKRGEIVTWDGYDIFNTPDDLFLPRSLTVKEYLESLVEVSGHLITYGALVKRLGIDEKLLGVTVGKAGEKVQSALRLAPVFATGPYVILYGEPFPEDGLLFETVNNLKENKVIILGCSDADTAKRIAAGVCANVVFLESGDLKSELIGDM